MGTILPFERPEPAERDDGAASDDASHAFEGEVVDLAAFLTRKLERLVAQQRAYTEKAERVVRTIDALKARMLHGETTDDERVALLDEFEGAEAVLAELLQTIRTISAEVRAGFEQSDRLQDHRRASDSGAAA